MIIVLISILSVLVVIFGYTTFNLLRKNEKAEDIIYSYKKYMDRMDEVINESDKKLKEIDAQGIFKNDDEIGWFFERVKLIQEIINQYKLRNF
jgi:hypothetical protein